MAEVFRSLERPVRHARGTYAARVIGRLAVDGMWDGWLEFVPLDPGMSEVVVSAIESRQPNRRTLEYWASGLSGVYAERALDRALNPVTVSIHVSPPASGAPAPRHASAPPAHERGPHAVLDPFAVGSRSLDILLQQLHALDRPRLLNIIAAYDLNPAGNKVSEMSEAQLVTFIVIAVEARLMQRAR